MKNTGFGHLKRRLFNIKTSENVGFGGPMVCTTRHSRREMPLDDKPLVCQGLIVIRLVRNPQEQSVHHFAMINFHHVLPNNAKGNWKLKVTAFGKVLVSTIFL